MAHEEVNVCGGLLVVKSDSGRPKIEKVLVETKPGKKRNELKCRIQKWVEGKKISALIMPRRKSSSSLIKLQENTIKSCLNQTSGDFLDVGKPVQNLELPVPKPKILVSKSEEEKVIRTENYDIDDDIISSDQSEEILTTTLHTTDEENKDSTIHLTFDDSNEDFESDEESILTPEENQKQEIKQHKSLVTAEPTPILHSSDENDESSSEDEEIVKLSEESAVLSQSYIDSGLRRLKSEESHLLIDPFLHKKKRKPPSLKKDPVKPILSELSSALFPGENVKARKVEESPKTEKIEESSDDLESTSEISEETEEEPFNKLKDLEDRKFKFILPSKTIKKKKLKKPFAAVREIVHPTSKGDFCVHTEEVPVKKKSSEEFCLHESKSASSLSVRFRDLTRSKSQGFSSISLIDNKEMRRSKYSKINLSKN